MNVAQLNKLLSEEIYLISAYFSVMCACCHITVIGIPTVDRVCIQAGDERWRLAELKLAGNGCRAPQGSEPSLTWEAINKGPGRSAMSCVIWAGEACFIPSHHRAAEHGTS